VKKGDAVMPRGPRLIIPDVPHHVTQKGNNGQDVFFDDGDRELYLSILRDRLDRYGIETLGYCLMRNHVHLIAVPDTDRLISDLICAAHKLYALKFNQRWGRQGHLWQERYYSCPMDESHLMQALQYVDRNPVRAGIVGIPWEYRWSSAKAHLGLGDQNCLMNMEAWERISFLCDWRELMSLEEDELFLQTIRKYTMQQKSLGSIAMAN
jgi:putative transposase